MVEGAVRAGIARKRLEQVVGAVSRGFVEHLIFVAGLTEYAVGDSGCRLVADDGFDRRPPDEQFAPPVMCGPDHGFCCDFGLEDWRHGLRAIGELARSEEHTSELQSR